MDFDQEFAVKTFVVSCFVLFVKFTAQCTIIGKWKAIAGLRAPEDAKSMSKGFGKAAPATQSYTPRPESELNKLEKKAYAMTKRYERAIGNDLETIPMTMFMAVAAILAKANPTVQVVALIVYTFFRCSHTYCMLKALMPLRTYVWSIALIASMVIGGNAVCAVLF
eukprot:GFYU01021169.1.p1 GENE.GFYU01021169.1~~GFYU01021169.1.p1  ORF type:complete len:166 (+),score=44.62 GFYU01021169.1:43-540(+)